MVAKCRLPIKVIERAWEKEGGQVLAVHGGERVALAAQERKGAAKTLHDGEDEEKKKERKGK